MKLSIRDQLAPIDWLQLKRSAKVPLALIAAVGVLAAVMQAPSRPLVATKPVSGGPRVLYIGDSLSVGKFGEYVGEHLVQRHGRNNVALYASCGSSPENWLRNGIHYTTRCGYRELTAKRNISRDPGSYNTPDIEDLIVDFKPAIVIVQLGTNWMDRLALRAAKEAEIRSYLRQFVALVRGQERRRLIWITPPDSSHYSKAVQEKVNEILWSASRESPTFEIIDSRDGRRPMTHYQLGVTGGDGIHYREKPAHDWAEKVNAVLDDKKV